MSKNKTEQKYRAPIVTIMGHVDHGKTSILDYIRKSNITTKEHGGITQHIGAYQASHNGNLITFIDTPGHEAFTQMRTRGGKAADIVILVVAADSSVQHQTKEAISIIKSTNVTPIVAINKVDLPASNPQKVKQDLAQENILVEDWGGDILCVEVSAKTGDGVDNLLDSILAVSELMELKNNPESELEATIIEVKKDRQRGVSVSCIVRNGTLKVGDEISASGYEAKVKSLVDDRGKTVNEALPSKPVEILGFKESPNVGDLIVEQGSELAELSLDEDRIEIVGAKTKKTVNVIIKADTQGTLEAIKASLASLVTDSVGTDFSLKFMPSSTGDITDSDILMASNTDSVIVGFNIKIKKSAERLADDQNVPVTVYRTIYELIDEVKDLLQGTAKKEEAKIKGRAYVEKIFKLPSGDVIAGCKVIAGAMKPEKSIKIYSKDPADLTDLDQPLYIGKIKKLKHGKDDVNIAGKDTECGILLKPDFADLDKNMWIEVF